MKKTMKRVSAFMLTMVAVLSLAACGGKKLTPAEPEPTAETLLAQFQKQTEAGFSCKGDVTLDLNMTVFGTDMSEDTKVEMDIASKDGVTRAEATVHTTDADGEETVDKSTNYAIRQDDGTILIYDNEDGRWVSRNTDSDPASSLAEMASANLTLSKAPLTDGKTEPFYYVLSGDADEETMQNLLSLAAGDAIDVDLSEIAAPHITYYFDGDTKELVSANVDMTETMRGIMEASMQQSLAENFGDSVDFSALMGMLSIEVNEMTISYKDFKFDPNMTIDLPFDPATVE